VPADRIKAGKVHLVPLDEGTVDVLERVRPLGVPASNLISPART